MTYHLKIPFSLILLFGIFEQSVSLKFIPQTSGVTERLRGVSAVNKTIAWASGSNGTCLRTIDGGMTWQKINVPGAEKLDFRDIEAFDANTAYLLSIGEGEKSRIYKTTDGGKSWSLQFANKNPKAFFDAIAFWDRDNGIAFSDPVDGRFLVIRTTDGGKVWQQVQPDKIPPALPNEGAFAASGTCMTVYGRSHAWFATGGAEKARVFSSADSGLTWQVAETPIAAGKPASGIFSVAFKDPLNGVVVGGDYQKEREAIDNVAITVDGGKTWELVKDSDIGGYRSAVAWAYPSMLIIVGPSGSEYSLNAGKSWKSFDTEGYDAISVAKQDGSAWATGKDGRIGLLRDLTRNTRN